MCQYKVDLILYFCCTSAYILCNGIFKYLESCSCIMESLDRLIECLCRIISQHPLEMSKCDCTFVKVFRFLYLVITACIRNVYIRTPVLTLRIHIVRLSILCRDYIQSFTLRISAVLNDLLTKERRNPYYILHQFYRIRKNLTVHTLKDHFQDSHL